MNKALFYMYRNLHKDLFSVKHRGLVIEHTDNIEMTNVIFKVSEKGRNRVLKEKRKNVHAVLGFDNYKLNKNIDISNMIEIYYDPYIYSDFVIKSTKKPIYKVKKAFGFNNKIYINEEDLKQQK